jgi:hypothetical protein
MLPSCRDYRLIVVRDAISGLQTRDMHELEGTGVVVLGSEKLLSGLQRPK